MPTPHPGRTCGGMVRVNLQSPDESTRAQRRAALAERRVAAVQRRRGYIERLNDWLDAEQRLADAENRRGWGIVVAATRRFMSIEGFDLAGLVALELFLTVVPLTIIGYALFAPHKAGTAVGDLYVRQLHLAGDDANLVRRTFGSVFELQAAYSDPWGLLGWAIWGIPMALTVAKVFAKAWTMPEPGFWTQVWRGTAWFLLYMAATVCSDVIEMSSRHLLPHGPVAYFGGMLVGLLPLVILWAASHPLLVPGARWNTSTMILIGLIGAVLTGPVMRIAEVPAFPLFMSWWEGFGPLGVAMTLLTWSMVQGLGWLVAACLGAVVVERRRRFRPDGNLLPPA